MSYGICKMKGSIDITTDYRLNSDSGDACLITKHCRCHNQGPSRTGCLSILHHVSGLELRSLLALLFHALALIRIAIQVHD